MKKFLAFVVFLAFGTVLFACNTNGGGSDQPSDPVNPDPEKAWYETDGDHTLNDFLGATDSLNWNPLSWETNDDSGVLGYLSTGFYDYKVNDTADNWEVVCEMASALPTDVTSSYIGEYGVEAGDENKAWSIPLNKDAVWENGQKITADDYIYSMQQQLDPDQLNRRADSYYGGDFSIYNAQNYLYNGKFAYGSPMVSAAFGDDEYLDPASFLVDEATGQYYVEKDGKKLYIGLSLTNGGNWGDAFSAYYNAGGEYKAFFMDGETDLFAELKKYEGKGVESYAGWVPMTVVTLPIVQNIIAHMHDFADAEAYAAAKGEYAYKEFEEMAFFGKYNDVMSFDEVGLVKVDDYTIVIILEKPLPNPTFYLPYYLSSTWLVNKDLYESCWTVTPDGETVNNYMQRQDTSISYGPYRLVSFEKDKELKFERNTTWYGYKDNKHLNSDGSHQYQTDNIVLSVIGKHETALLAFLAGDIDGVGLESDDMANYGSSAYLMYVPQSYTTKFTFVTDPEALKARETAEVNKLALTNVNFRAAVSYCMNRREFTSKFTAAAAPGYGLINYMYEVFLDDGSEMAYRNFDVAKKALVDLYGIEYGEGKDYADLDEAYAAITGYDMAKAKQFMAKAYEELKATNLYNDSQRVEIELSVYQNDQIYINMYNYIKGQIEEACKGTGFEGKVTVVMKVDADYYNSLYAGKTDMIFSTWGGATYGTLGLLSRVYCDDATGAGNQMEVGFHTESVLLTLTIAEVEYKASLKAFADWLNGGKIEGLKAFTEYDAETQVEVLAACEKAYLEYYAAIPLYYRQSASLYSQKINYPTKTYINIVGFGGVREITYNYTDAEWEAYKKSGNLKY